MIAFFPGGEPFIDPASRLLDADQAAYREHEEVVPGPEQVECPAVLDQVRTVENEDLGKAEERDDSQSKEAGEQAPLNIQACMLIALGGNIEFVAVRTYQRKGHYFDDLRRDQHLVSVGNQRQHSAAAEPDRNRNLRNQHGSEVRDRIRKVGLDHANVEQKEEGWGQKTAHAEQEARAPIEKRLDQADPE